MEWEKLFEGYRARDGYAEVSSRIYIHHPGKLSSMADIISEDKRTAQAIKGMERDIEALREYRIALQQRYGELATMDSRLVIRLERSHSYGCQIYYCLTTRRRYDDGTEAMETCKRYEGKFRHQAIKDFDALVAANPAAIAEKDIEKKAWEK